MGEIVPSKFILIHLNHKDYEKKIFLLLMENKKSFLYQQQSENFNNFQNFISDFHLYEISIPITAIDLNEKIYHSK